MSTHVQFFFYQYCIHMRKNTCLSTMLEALLLYKDSLVVNLGFQIAMSNFQHITNSVSTIQGGGGGVWDVTLPLWHPLNFVIPKSLLYSKNVVKEYIYLRTTIDMFVQIKLSIHLEEHMIRVSTLDKCTHMLSMCMHICVIIDIYPFLLDSKAKT
jgi:hypothetical protein